MPIPMPESKSQAKRLTAQLAAKGLIRCPKCGGYGDVDLLTCPRCGGSGTVKKGEKDE